VVRPWSRPRASIKPALGVMVAVVLLLIAAAAFGIYSLFFFARSQPFQSIKITKISGTHNARIGAMSPDGTTWPTC